MGNIRILWNDSACRLFLGVLGVFLAFMVYSLAFGKQVTIQADDKVYTDHKEVERKPQPKVVAYGPAVTISRSKLRPVVPEAMDIQGNERVITATSTAYTHTGHRTASGIKPYRGVVSVDPRVIPLGTKLFVENYGPAIALDTGGDMKGNRIDVFFDTREEALSWGRRSVKVRVLE